MQTSTGWFTSVKCKETMKLETKMNISLTGYEIRVTLLTCQFQGVILPIPFYLHWQKQ